MIPSDGDKISIQNEPMIYCPSGKQNIRGILTTLSSNINLSLSSRETKRIGKIK